MFQKSLAFLIGLATFIEVVAIRRERQQVVVSEDAHIKNDMTHTGTYNMSAEEEEMLRKFENQPFAPYYSQVFWPVAAHGHDYRMLLSTGTDANSGSDVENVLPSGANATSFMEESDMNSNEENDEDEEEEEDANPSLIKKDSKKGRYGFFRSKSNNSLIKKKSKKGRSKSNKPKENEREVECEVCQWAVSWLRKRCCTKNMHGWLTCNIQVSTKAGQRELHKCDWHVHFAAMYSAANEKWGNVCFASTMRKCRGGLFDRYRILRRVWNDMSALGTILDTIQHARNDRHLSDEHLSHYVCHRAYTESFDCFAAGGNNTLNNEVIEHDSHREGVCRDGEGWKRGWHTWHFCDTDINGRLADSIDVTHDDDDDVNHSEYEQSEQNALGLVLGEAFPEVELKFSQKANRWKAHGQDYENTERIDDELKTLANGVFDNPNMFKAIAPSIQVEGMTVSQYLLNHRLVVLLYSRNGKWYAENIPSEAFDGLWHLYGKHHHGCSRFKKFGACLARAYASKNVLARIGWSRGVARNYGWWGAENPEVKDTAIKDYMLHYNVDLKDIDMVLPRSNDLDDIVTAISSQFKTYNHFFYRRLKITSREWICYKMVDEQCCKDRNALEHENGGCGKGIYAKPTFVSPADSRVMVYPDYSVEEERQFWVKGERFHLEDMVDLHPATYRYYEGGTLLIFRLAPQDYHRYHFPVDGRIVQFKNYPGNAYSVNPIAVNNQSSFVFTSNKRMHALVDSGEKQFGCVLYISVGATNVNSVMHTSFVGQDVVRGMEHGYMAFGGSTVIALVRRGVLDLDKDLAHMWRYPVETLVKVGEHIGNLAEDHMPPPDVDSPCQ